MWDRQYLKVLRAVSMTKITKVIPEKKQEIPSRGTISKVSFLQKNWKRTPKLIGNKTPLP
jgi:hypothetical protein